MTNESTGTEATGTDTPVFEVKRMHYFGGNRVTYYGRRNGSGWLRITREHFDRLKRLGHQEVSE